MKDKAHPESGVIASSMGILSDTSGHWKYEKKQGKKNITVEKWNSWKITE